MQTVLETKANLEEVNEAL